MTHFLKTDPEPFAAAQSRVKGFELRKDDRHFTVDDTIVLQETQYSSLQMKRGLPLIFTGASCQRTITYILRGTKYGIKKGYCILSIK